MLPFQDIGIARSFRLSCAMGLVLALAAAPSARAADGGAAANTMAAASSEALALSGADVGDLSATEENAPAACAFPGGCEDQTKTVHREVKTILKANIETRGCTEVGPGTWSLQGPKTGPKEGLISTGTVKGTLKGCGSKIFTFGALFYTWTHPLSKLHDKFATEWKTKDFPKECPTCKFGLFDNLTVEK
jgi:hypothetical protein